MRSRSHHGAAVHAAAVCAVFTFGVVLALALSKLWMAHALSDPAFACLGMGSLALLGASS